MHKKITIFMRKSTPKVCAALLGVMTIAGSIEPVIASTPIATSIQQSQIDVVLKVLDETGEAVIGAVVFLKENPQKSAMVGVDGIAAINGVPSNGTLVIEFLGMKTTELKIDGRKEINVTMMSDAVGIQEVVVTGYGGSQLRSKVTNSIAKVKSETLTTGLFSNPAQALVGAVPGLRVIQSSGSPGASPTIILRGGTNLDGSGSPLVIMDGQVRTMSDINPEDIESMEVMKDAGATAIYGARANNGVILISTKRGKQGSAQISIKAKVGVNFLTTANEFLNGEEYISNMRTAYQRASQIYKDSKGNWQGTTNMSSLNAAQPYGTGNLYWDPKNPGVPLDGNKDTRAVWSTMKYTDDLSFLLDQGWKTMIDPVYGDKLIYTENYMSDFNITSPTISQDYNASMSGGNDKGSYYAGIGYNHQKGMPVDAFYSRLNFLFNGDYKVASWLKSSSSFQFTEAKWNNMPASQTSEAIYFGRALSVPTTFRGYNANGEALMGPNSSDGNQSYQNDRFIRKNQSDKFTMNQTLDFRIIEDLHFKVNATWYYEESNSESFNKDYMTSPGQYNRGRAASAGWNRSLRETYNGVLSYNKQIKDHYISAMAGMEYYNYSSVSLSGSGSGASSDDFGNLQYTDNKENMRSMSNGHDRNRIMSFFGRVNYDYLGKYLISAVVRQDGYSTLSQENRWGFFPGVSVGWVMSKENFFAQMTNVVSFAKLRSSFGLNGNVSDLGSYTVQGGYGSNRYNGNIGYALSTIPNPYLLWEKSRTFEVGLDLAFLQNRYTVGLTYYNRLTSDKFANIVLPVSSGLSSIRSNNGEIQNQGIEIDLGARLVDKGDWKWSVSLNAAYNQNIIKKLPNNGLERNRQNSFQVYTGNGDEKEWVGGFQEGQEYGSVYGFQAEGIYQSYDEIRGDLKDISSGNNGANNKPLYGPDAWAKLTDAQKKNGLPIQPGDVKWTDVNNDGVIDNFDKVKLGNSVPRWTGGFNTTLKWKSLTFSASLDFALDFWTSDYGTPWYMGAMQGTMNSLVQTRDTWSPTNTGAKYPTYIWADQLGKRNYARETSMFMYRGDYINFREVMLSYALPSTVTKALRMQKLEVSVTGQNLGFLSANPQAWAAGQNSSHNNGGGYPLPRTIIFGLNITF